MRLKVSSVVLALALAVIATGAAGADEITTFTLQDVTFPSSSFSGPPYPTTVLQGAFTYDVNNGEILSSTILVTSGQYVDSRLFFIPGCYVTGNAPLCVPPFISGGNEFSFIRNMDPAATLFISIAHPITSGSEPLDSASYMFVVDEDIDFNSVETGELFATTVPEPMSLALLATGLATLWPLRRAHRRSRSSKTLTGTPLSLGSGNDH